MARAIHATDERAREGVFWKDAVLAGLIGGAVFMMAEMLLVMLIGQSPWGPPRMMAAMVMGRDVLPPPADFSGSAVLMAMMIHFPLSALFGLLIGAIVKSMTMAKAVAIGAVIGVAMYVVNFYIVTSFAFEWFANARNWVTFITHVMFGAVIAWAYIALARRSASVSRTP